MARVAAWTTDLVDAATGTITIDMLQRDQIST
jgi:hypothetical protein